MSARKPRRITQADYIAGGKGLAKDIAADIRSTAKAVGFVLEAGRCITLDSVPLVTIGRCDRISPALADKLARVITEALNDRHCLLSEGYLGHAIREEIGTPQH